MDHRQFHSHDIERTRAGEELERPRSALHSGDFTEGPRQSSSGARKTVEPTSGLYNPTNEWLATSSPREFSPFQLDTRFPPVDVLERARSRAPSLSSSLSSSFVMKAPTSPLVQSERNEDLDFSSIMDPIDISRSLNRHSRRHTLQTSTSAQSSPSVPTLSSYNRPLPHLRRDNTFPYQAHQPRRSLTLNQSVNSLVSPQTPLFPRSRRPSCSSDSSPLHHASMVGSYEESILRGRMSTNPSKPLDFVAQIGVLGLGKCKSNLRCPPHVTLPFPAVFYSYETTAYGRTGKLEDGPSPYVGQIDLENNLPNQEDARERKRKHVPTNTVQADAGSIDGDMLDFAGVSPSTDRDLRLNGKHSRRSTSLRAPPGGSYRIPEKGQLQIIIKNPNKTAVKLFLVPYDLAGMEPGTKTFIRQRSYSAGPIIESALSSSSQVPLMSLLDRPILRYLVHLHICSPSRGRFYLYKSIRVVFANRVPDGKEKLRNEVSLPEPRFSLYKPGRDSNIGTSLTNGAGANLAAEKAYRRRSSGFALSRSHHTMDSADGLVSRALDGGVGGTIYQHEQVQGTHPVHPIPSSIYRKSSASANLEFERFSDIQSPASSKSSQPSASQESNLSYDGNDRNGGLYDKLNRGDAGYGGNIFHGSPDGRQVAESLLAKKLRDLGVNKADTNRDCTGSI